MQKVSMWAAVKKTRLLLMARSSHYLKYVAALFVLNGLSGVAELYSPDEAASAGAVLAIFLGIIVVYVGMTGVHISLQHFTIASCRNQTSFMPEKPGKTIFMYIINSIAISAIAMVAGIIAALPLIGLTASGVFDGPDVGWMAYAGGFVLGLVALLGSLLPAMRFGAILPAVAIGDNYSFSKAWNMTKGHSGRLLVSFITLSLLASLFAIVWGGAFGLANPGAVFEPSITFVVLNTTITVCVGLFMTVFYGIVYDDLNSRHEAMQGGGASIAPEGGDTMDDTEQQ